MNDAHKKRLKDENSTYTILRALGIQKVYMFSLDGEERE
jgi:hypothetical protein